MKRWLIFSLGLILIIALACWVATIQPYKLILDDEYFQIAHREIQKAKASIYLITYLFLIYDYENAYTNRLLNDLIEAHKRGVGVHVVLDYPRPEYMSGEQPQNQKAYNKLKEAGIDVRFDSAEKTTHSKLIVIDAQTIIIGSHNLSSSGMKHNYESSLLLRDRYKAKKLIEYFNQIE